MADPATYGGPMVTGEAVALEVRPAGIGSRGIALLLDLLVQYALILFVSLVAARLLGGLESAAARAAYVVVMVLIVLGYPVGMETLWRGRTLGKAAMGVRVVRDDGGPIRFRHAFVRGLVGVVVDRPGLSLGLLALVPMLMTARSKRLGDLSAGTVVVQERIPARVTAPPVMPPGADGWAATLDLSGVGDALALEVRQFLARSADLAPWARDQMGTRLLAELAARVAPPPPGMPPGVYFAAVLAERRRRELARTAPPVAVPPATASPVPPPPAAAGGAGSQPPDDLPPPGPFTPPA